MMRKVKCYECGRQYDFDTDDFCPRCGAFNQPQRSSRIGADGSVVWADGMNESYHRNSFVHAELHEENRERRGTPLAKGVRRIARGGTRPQLKLDRIPFTRSTQAENEAMAVKALLWGCLILFLLALNFAR